MYKVGVDVLHSRLRGDERQRTGADRALGQDARQETGLRRRNRPVGARHRRRACSRKIASSPAALAARIRSPRRSRCLRATLGVAPRVGMAVMLNESARAVLRGGYGLFFERTPSIAGAFGQFESALDTRFAADGKTPLGPPVLYRTSRRRCCRPLGARSGTWRTRIA